MENFEEYYRSAQELLEAQGYSEAAKLVSLSNVHEEYVNYDNWNGGSDMYSISVYVTPIMYAKLEREKRTEVPGELVAHLGRLGAGLLGGSGGRSRGARSLLVTDG